jgi:hypothetical protein
MYYVILIFKQFVKHCRMIDGKKSSAITYIIVYCRVRVHQYLKFLLPLEVSV